MKYVKFWFVFGVLLTIISPFLFTRSWGIIDFRETGSIGDTIGGITGPITNLIGALLVFYALRAQIEANEIIRKQFEQQKIDELERKKLFYITEQINIIRNDINEFSYVYSTTRNITENGSAFSVHFQVLPDKISRCKREGLDPF